MRDKAVPWEYHFDSRRIRQLIDFAYAQVLAKRKSSTRDRYVGIPASAEIVIRLLTAVAMPEEKTTCSSCGRSILKRTAERRNGMCAPCQRNGQKSPEELFEEAVFTRIDEAIEPFSSYKDALAALAELPRGYSMCFAFHYVHADILNGGISQLYGNSTWPLVVDAVEAAKSTNNDRVAYLLCEIIYYYHEKNRSKLKRSVTEDFFTDIPTGWRKSLSVLDDEYFALEDQANTVIPKLCKQRQVLFEASPEEAS